MCGTDWQHEFHPNDGPSIFDSLAALKRARSCWKQCGILKLRITPLSWHTAQNLLGKPKK